MIPGRRLTVTVTVVLWVGSDARATVIGTCSGELVRKDVRAALLDDGIYCRWKVSEAGTVEGPCDRPWRIFRSQWR